MRKLVVLVTCVVGLIALSTSAFAVGIPFVAPGTSNIFTSGYASVGAAGGGDGTLAPNISFAAGGGTLTFSGITGTVGCRPFCASESAGPKRSGGEGQA